MKPRIRRKNRLLALCLSVMFSILPLSEVALAAGQDCGREKCQGLPECLQSESATQTTEEETSEFTPAPEPDPGGAKEEKPTAPSEPDADSEAGKEEIPKAMPAPEPDAVAAAAGESLEPGVYAGMTVLALPGASDTKQLIGTGTAEDPLLIYTAEDLRFFALSHNAGLLPAGLPDAPHLRAASAVIDLSAYSRCWEPLGTVDRPFRGTFAPAEGISDVSITNLSVEDSGFGTSETVAAGLFGATDGAELTAIRVIGSLGLNADGRGEARAGLLVGQAVNTELIFCSATGYIQISTFATATAGGLAGLVRRTEGGTAAAECASDVEIGTMCESSVVSGGLIGRVDVEHTGSSAIAACYAAGRGQQATAQQDVFVGGLAGVLNAGGGAQLNVSDSYAAGKQYAAQMTGNSGNGQVAVGGLIGTAQSTGGSSIRAERCYASDSQDGVVNIHPILRVGALAGLVSGDAESSFSLESCAALGEKVSAFSVNSSSGEEDIKLGTVWGARKNVNASAKKVFTWSGMKLDVSGGQATLDDTTGSKKNAVEWKDSAIWVRDLGFDGPWSLDAGAENRIPTLTPAESLGIYQNPHLPSYIKGLSGSAEDGNVYTVSSEDELAYLARLVNEGKRNEAGKLYADAKVRVIKDIELHSSWNPIGTAEHPFQGSFVGWDEDAGKETVRSISGLSLGIQEMGEDGKMYVCGLFGNVEAKEEGGVRTNVCIRGIALEDVYSYFQGYADNTPAGGNQQKGIFCAGALVGRGAGLDVEGCSATGRSNAFGGSHMYSGGLVGLLESPAEGADAGSISRSAAHMEVQAEDSYHVYTGGILGGLKTNKAGKESVIRSCYAAGFQTAVADKTVGERETAYSGGIVGYVGGEQKPGQSLRHLIEDCYATGPQKAEAPLTAVAGGIVGNHDDAGGITFSVSHCYATGSLRAAAMTSEAGRMAAAGGIIGSIGGNPGDASIKNCAALGFSVEAETGGADGGTPRTGRVAGAPDGTPTGEYNCAWSMMQINGVKVTDASGQNDVGYGKKHGKSVDSAGFMDGTETRNIWTKAANDSETDPGLGFFEDPAASAWELAGWPAAPTLRGLPGQDGACPSHLKGFENVGADADPILAVRTVEELSLLAVLVNGGEQYSAGGAMKPYSKLTYYLLEDLDLSGVNSWTAIGGAMLSDSAGTPYKTAFEGTFAGMTWDGGSGQYVPAVRTVSNLRIDRERSKEMSISAGGSYDEGLFGNVSGASISNIAIKKMTISFFGPSDDAVSCNVGGLAGRAEGSSFTACSVEGFGAVGGFKSVAVGGLVGIVDDGGSASATSLERCFGIGTWAARADSFNGTPTKAFAGGLAGLSQLQNRGSSLDIRDCYGVGTITATGVKTFAGGLAASLTADNGGAITVERCYAVSEVKAKGTDGTAGGMAGLLKGAGAQIKDSAVLSTKVAAQADAGRVCGKTVYGAALHNVYAWEDMQVNGKSVKNDSEAKGDKKHGADIAGEQAFSLSWWKETLGFGAELSKLRTAGAPAWTFREGYLPLLELPSADGTSGDTQQALRPFHLLNVPGAAFTLEITADKAAVKKSEVETTVQLTAALKDPAHPDLAPTMTPSGYEWTADYGGTGLTVAPDMSDSSKAVLTFTPNVSGEVKVKVKPVWYDTPSGALTLPIEASDLPGKIWIEGTAQTGQTLTAKTEGVPADAGKLTYTWQRDGTPIPNAAGISYKLTPDDEGRQITAVLTAEYYKGALTSEAVVPKGALKPEPKQEASGKRTPDTGDDAPVGPIVLAGIGSLAVLWAVLRRLRRK